MKIILCLKPDDFTCQMNWEPLGRVGRETKVKDVNCLHSLGTQTNSGASFSPPKNSVCELELQNDFCDAFPPNPFYGSWFWSSDCLIILRHKNRSQTPFFGGEKRSPEIRLRSKASVYTVYQREHTTATFAEILGLTD